MIKSIYFTFFYILITFSYNAQEKQIITLEKFDNAKITVPSGWGVEEGLGVYAFYSKDNVQRFRISMVKEPAEDNCPTTVESLKEATLNARKSAKVISTHKLSSGVGIVFESKPNYNNTTYKEYWFFIQHNGECIFIKSGGNNLLDKLEAELEYIESLSFN